MTSGRANPRAEPHPPHCLTERVIGASHLRTLKPCQDEAGFLVVGDIAIVAIADGHGSSRLADVGARLAVQVALTSLVRFAEELGHRSASIGEVQQFASHPLRVQIVREWTERVRSSAGAPDAALIDYGSTLLFAVSTRDFLLVGQLGDGDVLLVGPDRQVSVVIPPDPRAFADETPSLCLPEAWHSLRVRVLPAPQQESLLLLSTDGYSNSYPTDEVFRQIGPDYLDLVREEGIHGLAPHLQGFLEQVTSQGSGDDIAVGLLYWPPIAPESGAATTTPDDIKAPIEAGTDPVSVDPEGPVARASEEVSIAAGGGFTGPDAPSEATEMATQATMEAANPQVAEPDDVSSTHVEKTDERVPEDG